ncbi:MAG: thiamine pyrophosphate-dependent enzyme [Gemmatimonadota bacterium]
MIRSTTFDPPEYAGWKAEPELVQQYLRTISQDSNRKALIEALDRDPLLELYRRLVRARLIDQVLAGWVRQGVIAEAWLATGEEACTTGPLFALDPKADYILPVIRNHSANADFGLPLVDLFRSYLGSTDGPSRGRDAHPGSVTHHVIPPIGSPGAMVPVCLGLALAAKIQNRASVALTWIGDGATKSGPTHEGLNMAAVQRVPAVFIIQHHQVALGAGPEQHHWPADFSDWPEAYGMAGGSFDGNHVLDAWAATALAVQRCRRGEGPVMLVTNTFRMGGRSTDDERQCRDTITAESFSAWGKRDPIGMYEEYLRGRGVPAGELSRVEAVVRDEVDQAAESAGAGNRDGVPESALSGVYARESIG